MKLFKKLDARGVAHHFVLVFIVLAVAIGGAYHLVASHADSIPYSEHIVSATCSSITAAGHDENAPNSYVQIRIYDNTDAQWLTPYQKVAGGGSDTYTWTASQFLAADSRVAKPTASGTITVTEHIFDTISGTLKDETLSSIPPSGDVATTTLTLGSCVKAAPTPAPVAPAPAKAAHIYSGYIVASPATCTADIQVEAEDTGASPDGKMSVEVELSGGPYTSTAILGPTSANDAPLTGSGSDTFHHWPLPAAVQTNSVSPITLTLVVRDNGVIVAVTNPASQTTKSIPVCATKTTAKQTAAAAHQYESHIVSLTCNNIEVEAKDFGAAPTGKIYSKVTLRGGPYTTTVALGPNQVNQPDIDGANGLKNYYHWATPSLVQNYNGAVPVTATLTTYDYGIGTAPVTLSITGTQTMVLGACDQATPQQAQAAAAICNLGLTTPLTGAKLQACEQKVQASIVGGSASNDTNSPLTLQDVQTATADCEKTIKPGTDGRNEKINECVIAAEQKIDPLLPSGIFTAPKQSTVAKVVEFTKTLPKKLVNNLVHPFGVGTACVNKQLSQGDSGGCVSNVQILVDRADNSINLQISHEYDSATVTGVEKLQLEAIDSHGTIASDGIVGPNTWAKLCAIDKSKASGYIYGYSVAKVYKDAGCDKLKTTTVASTSTSSTTPTTPSTTTKTTTTSPGSTTHKPASTATPETKTRFAWISTTIIVNANNKYGTLNAVAGRSHAYKVASSGEEDAANYTPFDSALSALTSKMDTMISDTNRSTGKVSGSTSGNGGLPKLYSVFSKGPVYSYSSQTGIVSVSTSEAGKLASDPTTVSQPIYYTSSNGDPAMKFTRTYYIKLN